VIAWIIFMFVASVPSALDFLVMDLLNLSRTMDFFIIVGFMFLIAAVFYTYTIVRRMQQKVEKMVREMAIERAKK